MSADQGVVRARALLGEAKHVVAFTGAGLSTASGIPDFRGPDGLWTRIDPAELTYERFLADPARFWRWRTELRKALRMDDARPNAAHLALAAAVRSRRIEAIVTQNIDGLQQAAGTPDDAVIELHGSGRDAVCTTCASRIPIAQAAGQLDAGRDVPRCETCGGVLKPAVVLFGETLPVDAFRRAERLAREADVMLVAGSSLAVYPAADLPLLTLRHGGALVIINGEATPLDQLAAVRMAARVEHVVPRLFA